MSEQVLQVWPLRQGDNACPYCWIPLNITGQKEGMYTLECPKCKERFITEAALFRRMMS